MPALDERLDGLAQRRTRDPELLGELALGRQARAGGEDAQADGGAQPVHRLLERRGGLDRLEDGGDGGVRGHAPNLHGPERVGRGPWPKTRRPRKSRTPAASAPRAATTRTPGTCRRRRRRTTTRRWATPTSIPRCRRLRRRAAEGARAGQRPKTSARAASRLRSSSAARRPTASPRRSGITAVVCSTRTRVVVLGARSPDGTTVAAPTPTCLGA